MSNLSIDCCSRDGRSVALCELSRAQRSPECRRNPGRRFCENWISFLKPPSNFTASAGLSSLSHHQNQALAVRVESHEGSCTRTDRNPSSGYLVNPINEVSCCHVVGAGAYPLRSPP